MWKNTGYLVNPRDGSKKSYEIWDAADKTLCVCKETNKVGGSATSNILKIW